MTEEIWKPVQGFDRYEVSSFGRVRSHYFVPPLILSCAKTDKGYPSVDLRLNGSRNNFAVHRLVAVAFVSNPSNKPQVNHKDSNRANNHYLNLEWVTHTENMRHSIDKGRLSPMSGTKDKYYTKELIDQMKCTQQELNCTQKELAIIFGVPRSTIQNLLQFPEGR